jgi:chemotaxis protein methyltransferase CheR
MTLPLSAQVFSILGALVEERSGLHYGEEERELFGGKVAARAQQAGFESLLEYYYFLRYDPGGDRELEILIEHLVVGETYFFRELDQLRLMVDAFVAPRVQAGHRVRVWSAACATGEEPLGIAMLLSHRNLLGSVDLVASDVSSGALRVAREGRYGRRSVRRELPPEAAGQLTVAADGTAQVNPSLIDQVTFCRLNLLDAAAIDRLGLFDVVLCRNVLIYFSDTGIRDTAERLARALVPGGALFVGVSESLLRFGTSLACEEQAGVFFYRKVAR